MDFGGNVCVDFSKDLNMPESVATVVRLSRLLEDAGFTHVWLGDTVHLGKDAYMLMTLCAVNTEKVKIGTAIINLSRDIRW